MAIVNSAPQQIRYDRCCRVSACVDLGTIASNLVALRQDGGLSIGKHPCGTYRNRILACQRGDDGGRKDASRGYIGT